MWAQNYKKIAIVCRKKCIFVSVNPDAIHIKRLLIWNRTNRNPLYSIRSKPNNLLRSTNPVLLHHPRWTQ